jgi:hypothetical protein
MAAAMICGAGTGGGGLRSTLSVAARCVKRQRQRRWRPGGDGAGKRGLWLT